MEEYRIKTEENYGAGYYAIVRGSDLVGSVPGENCKEFWGGYSHHRAKPDYQQLILDSQDYINKVMTGELLAEDMNYYIYGTDLIAQLKRATIYKISDTAFQGSMWILDPVYVLKDGNSYRFDGPGGKHRFAAARGMDCYIIVYVDRIE